MAKLDEGRTVAYQRSQGMRVLNTYVHTGDDGHDYFVWLREFDNEQARQALYEKNIQRVVGSRDSTEGI